MPTSVAEFLSLVPEFDSQTPREQILLFGWYLHAHRGLDTFGNSDIRSCFREINSLPPDVTVYLPRLLGQGELIKVRSGYQLERATRRSFEEKYGSHPTAVAVARLLADLPEKVPNLPERAFLAETINCYRVGAFRAAIVMAWNLALDHLLSWILGEATRLAAFNSAIATRYPKKKDLEIKDRADFEELTEREIVEICRTANFLSKNVIDVLREKLTRRNACAHPSTVVVVQPQADDAITDLINNVVLQLR
ncbi:MAG TPA: hypothetical protein VHM90_20785 [Phycisphaerae bacterium]|nr:hypothetical protein [Phycisphaerae bacterium]